MGDWSELPADLVRRIEEKLFFYQDKVRYRCVCSSWRLNLPKMPHQKHDLMPWLLVPLQSKSESGPASFGFFDPLEKKIHRLELSDFQEKGMLFRGSSHGWVVNLEKNNSIVLINPFTGAQVQLPPRSSFPDVKNYRPNKPGKEYGMREDFFGKPGFFRRRKFYTLSESHVRTYFTDKVFLSSSPQSKDFVAVAIYGEFSSLAYCKPGDKRWTFLGLGYGGYSDVVFHRGQMYALRDGGKLLVCDIHHPFPKLTILVSPPFSFYSTLGLKQNLVESSTGELIMVDRDVKCLQEIIGTSRGHDIHSYKTHGIKIYKLDTSKLEWYQVKDIDQDIFFVGWNSSLSMSCSHPFSEYIDGNCIYFTDDVQIFHNEGIVGGFEIGVFNLTNETIKELPGYTSDSKLLLWPPPLWFMPNPY